MNNQSGILNPKPKIAIIGAGPAGSSLAIRLVGLGYETVLLEREKFPRHKLCGEFISPECLPHFKTLGVRDDMLARGGALIEETVFYEPGGRSVTVPSEWFGGSGVALSLSRAEMDLCLLERAKAVGVDVREETAVSSVTLDNGSVRNVRTRDAEIEADIFIDATGRSRVLSKLIGKHSGERANGHHKSPLVGFKAHLNGANIEPNRCEIYSFRGGYGGLSPIEGGLANFCFLIKASVVRELIGNTNKILEDIIFKNRRAEHALRDAVPASEWLAVAVDSFGAKRLRIAPNAFAVGDSAAFIDPFTGSGMLMALESSEVFARCIAGQNSLENLASGYAAEHDKTFAKRLRVSSYLRHAAFVPGLAKLAVLAFGVNTAARRIFARSTR
jgi:flavin-dependent dehydrogenase